MTHLPVFLFPAHRFLIIICVSGEMEVNMAKIKLFCIPYAGGSAMVYTKWKKFLHDDLELYPVELSGRGKRIGEPFYDSFEEAVDDIFYSISDNLDDDYAIFGHSLGSWLALELTYKIYEKGCNTPKHIFFSGNRAPHIYKKEKILHKLPDLEFKKEIFNIGGTPKEFFEAEELMELFLPILRSDYRLLENYHYKRYDFCLNTNITIVNGIDDDLSYEELEAWKEYTKGDCRICNLTGDHFFFIEEAGEITKLINKTLSLERVNSR